MFPRCNTVNPLLSCEAVYWEKRNLFLCRGKKCDNPKVLPDLNKHYFDFTIYDWFGYYNINFLDEKKPSSRDFPIKLAGYFNRLKEIFPILHCRSCESLMLPDLAYARVEQSVIRNGILVKENLAPAYRITTFKCKNSVCSEYYKGIYISHCMGFGCYGLIDSRISRLKCNDGLYICRNCASCCGTHGKTNPVGLCPDCTFPLTLYMERSSNMRLVKCNNKSCNFTIPEEQLTKKFNSIKPIYH